jgi:hypothetical protein
MSLRAAVIFALSALAAGQSRPDFSGVWEMNVSKSTPAPPTTAVWIMAEQTAAGLNVVMRSFAGDKEEKYLFKYVFGSESSNNLHGARMISHLAWDENTLAITSLAMYGTQPLNMVDRWTLDGDTLTIRIMTQFDREPARNQVRIMERRSLTQWPPENTTDAGKVYRNIQVLKSLPASSLTEVMTQFTNDLGVTCAFCHVGSDMDRDDKATKQMARRMILMTNRINASDFGGRNLVTCGTCHRGSAKPAQ